MSSYSVISPEILAKIEEIVGTTNVTNDSDKMYPYSHDEEGDPHYQKLPEAVAWAESTDQVSQLIKLANEAHFPVTPRGAGTGLAAGAAPLLGGLVLSLEKMNKILEVNEDHLFVIAQAGALTEEVQKAALAKGLFYAGDPCSGDSCSIGGNVATNAGGNKAVKYGTTREQVLEIEVVNPLGEVVRLGGRIAKTSTGYALKHLIIGSEGTLGIITEVTLKLLPNPVEVMDFLVVFPEVPVAISTVGKILKAGIDPTCLEFMDNEAVKSVERYLGEKLPHGENGHYLIVQVEGKDETDLEDKAIALDELCTECGAIAVLVADPKKIWQARKDFAEAVRAESLIHNKEDVVVPIDKIPELMEISQQIGERYGLVTRTASHAGDGNTHLLILKNDTPDEEWEELSRKFQTDLYEAVYRLGGKMSGEHGIGAKRQTWMEQFTPQAELQMMQAIKKGLDPNHILNPNKIFKLS